MAHLQFHTYGSLGKHHVSTGTVLRVARLPPIICVVSKQCRSQRNDPSQPLSGHFCRCTVGTHASPTFLLPRLPSASLSTQHTLRVMEAKKLEVETFVHSVYLTRRLPKSAAVMKAMRSLKKYFIRPFRRITNNLALAWRCLWEILQTIQWLGMR